MGEDNPINSSIAGSRPNTIKNKKTDNLTSNFKVTNQYRLYHHKLNITLSWRVIPRSSTTQNQEYSKKKERNRDRWMER